jgi:acetolactate synthase-1/2/3 large subunit
VRVADYIVNYFLEKGVKTCFCVTGGGAMHLNDAFGHNKEVEVIYNHHEQACAMAAEGYTRVTQIPAIVSVTSGPGATNAITGVYGAWQDSIPMIVISGQMKSETIVSSTPVPVRYLGFQEADIIPLVSEITKYAAAIRNINDLRYHLDKAYYLATTGRKGPVWLDIPLDIQGANYDDEKLINYPKFIPNLQEANTSPDRSKMFEVVQRLKESKKPVIMLGEEVRISGASNLIEKLADRLGIPVVTEWNAHDLIDQDSYFQCGRPGTIGDRGGNYVVQSSDTLLCIGCQLSIRQISYEWKNFAKDAFIIAVNIDANELGKPTINIDMPIVSCVRKFIEELLYIADNDFKLYIDNWVNWCRWINKKYPVVDATLQDNDKPINVYNFIKTLSEFTPKNTNVVLANGAACVCGLQAFEIRQNVRLFTNAGASSMGYGIAASVGAALADNRKNMTICIEGDGSIMMNLQEIQTIVQNRLNVKIFIINNDGYHSIKQTQNSLFNAEKKGLCGADNTSGISFPSFEKIAQAFDVPYFKIKRINEMSSVIKEFIESKGYSICEIFTDPNQVFSPKLASKMNSDGSFFTPSLEYMSPFLEDIELEENKFKPNIKY